MAADDFKLIGNHLVHRYRRVGLFGEQEPNLDMPTQFSQALDRIYTGGGVTQGIQRYVSSTAGCFHHRFNDIAHSARIDRRYRAQRTGKCQFVIGDVDSNHIGADGTGNHHRRQADTAAAMYGQPLTGRYLALIHHGAEGGRKPAPQAGGGGKVEVPGKRDQVNVGLVNRDIFGEGSPVGEARLCLVATHLVVAGLALGTEAAAADKGSRDPVADFKATHVGTNCLDGTRKLMARDVGQLNTRIMTHPAMPVAAAYAGCHHLYHHPVGRWCGIGDIHKPGRSGKSLIDDGFHGEVASCFGSEWILGDSLSIRPEITLLIAVALDGKSEIVCLKVGSQRQIFPMSKMDGVDIDILARLQRDGRLSNAKLAAALSLSETPCWRRIKRLEEEGYIESYQANLDRRKLKFGVMAFVQLTCVEHDEQTTATFEEIIQGCDNVLSCHNTTGEADFLLQVVAKDLDDYSRFVDKVLRKLPGVSAIRSNLSLRELKSSNRLPIKG